LALPSLDIVVVDFDSWPLVSRCLESIDEIRHTAVRISTITVVRNPAGIGARETPTVRRGAVRILENERNVGFAAACNQGAQGSHADYLLFLNPDTEVLPGALDKAVSYLEDPTREKVGVVGVRLIDASGNVVRSCRRFPAASQFWVRALALDRLAPKLFDSGLMAAWPHDDTRVVDQVMGAFLLVRRRLFEQLSGFDERFFVYYEEVDLCLRARQLGFVPVFLHSVSVRHVGCGTTANHRADRLFYNLNSRLLFAAKHFGPFAKWSVSMCTWIFEPISRIIHSILARSWKDCATTIRAYARLLDARRELSPGKQRRQG
jgi:N-acetylglucosaminyl-diphospho-decaprenol L-rhamnosyltransferase